MLMRYRLDDHEDLKNAEARMGKQMAHNELIRRVVKLNPNVWAEDSRTHKNGIGFYTTDSEGNKKYLVAFEKGYLPEFSYIIVDRADLPIKEVRGWRTVLLRLLKQGVLTWKQIVDVFEDAYGYNAKRWQHYTRQHKG